jgi:hypothetical protein
VLGENYYASGQDHIGKRAVDEMCRVAQLLMEQEHFEACAFVQELLQELEKLVPLMVLREKPMDMDAFPPYSMARAHSVGRLVEIAAEQIGHGEDKAAGNPYRKFLELNEGVYMHFRQLAESQHYDIQRSFLAWLITDTIVKISGVYRGILSREITESGDYNGALASQVGWYQSFFWALFDNKKEVDACRAEAVADAMAVIGLQFARDGYSAVAENSVENIASVAKQYVKRGGRAGEYELADIIIHIWEVRLFAEQQKNTSLKDKSDERLAQVIAVAQGAGIRLQKALVVRQEQLRDWLERGDSQLLLGKARDYLKVFLG